MASFGLTVTTLDDISKLQTIIVHMIGQAMSVTASLSLSNAL